MKLIHKETNLILANDLRIAESFWDRTRGLMFRNQFPGDGLVIEPCNSIHNCFVRFPIDVIFVDKNLRIVKILKNFKPWRFSLIYLKAKKVFELPIGTLNEKIAEGDQLEVQGV